LLGLKALGDSVNKTSAETCHISCDLLALLPMRIAVTEKNVTGALKKIMPEMATGNLFNAPAILQ